MSNTIQLHYLPVGNAWAFIFGDGYIVALDGKRLFSSREEAVWYAREMKLSVAKNGNCESVAVQGAAS